MADSRTLSKRREALYDDGVHWVSPAVSREFAVRRFAYGVWQRERDPLGDVSCDRHVCRRAALTSDEAISIAQRLTAHVLKLRPETVGNIRPVPVSSQQVMTPIDGAAVNPTLPYSSFNPVLSYSPALKRAINKAYRECPHLSPKPLPPLVPRKIPGPYVSAADAFASGGEVVNQQFDRRGFRVARNDGLFEHWVFDPMIVSIDKWTGRRGPKSKPMHDYREGTVILTRDDRVVAEAGRIIVFPSMAHAEEWADERIAETPEDEYIPLRSIDGRKATGHGIVYQHDDIVAWFQPGYGMTAGEMVPTAKAPWALPYIIFRKFRQRGSESVTLHALCPRRRYSPEQLVMIDPVTGDRRTMIKGDHVMRDVEQPIRTGSIATAIEAVDDIRLGRRLHGYLRDLQLQGESKF